MFAIGKPLATSNHPQPPSIESLKSAIMHIEHLYIEAFRKNDPLLIREIYARYSISAMRWIQKQGGSIEDAKDIFQDTLMIIYDKAQQPDFVLTCPFGALLHIIYTRKWVDRLRLKNREAMVRNAEELRYESEFSEDATIVAEAALAEQKRQEQMAHTFQKLSERCRQLLSLLSNGMSPRDAVEHMDMNSVDTLYRRKNACMQRWRELLKSEK